MEIRKSHLGLIFLAAMLVTCAGIFTASSLGMRVITENAAIHEQARLADMLQGLYASVGEVESNQRGYLLTGEKPHLERYSSSLQHVEDYLKRLANRAETGEIPLERQRQIHELARERLTLVAGLVDLQQRGNTDEALRLFKESSQETGSQALATALSGLISEELLQLDAMKIHRDRQNLLRTTLTVSIAAILIGFLVWAFRRAAWAITSTELLFSQMTEGLAYIEILCDRENKPRDFRFLAVNPGFETHTGLSGPAIVGRTYKEIFPAADNLFVEFFGNVALSGKPNDIEAYFSPLDKYFQISAFKTRLGKCAALFIDLTDRMKASEKLRDALQLLAFHVDHSPLAVIEWGPDMRLIRWSGEAERMFGWTAQEVLGKRMEDFRWIYREDAQTVQEVAAVLRTGRDPRRVSFNRNYRKDGVVIDCEWYNSSIVDDKGKLRSILSLVLDVTERNRAQAALAEAKAAAEQARLTAEEANRAKDHFLAVLSHELRTPLTPVLATTSLLKADPLLLPAHRQDIELIQRNIELEARLIDDLLDITRITRGKIELDRRPLRLVDVLEQAVQVCRSEIQARRLDFSLETAAAAEAVVEADSARLQQVFWNLLKNAIKFTPQGGRVRVCCRLEGQHVLTEVHDSGEGIDADVLPRLFSPFEQGSSRVTRQFGGLGLGLAITKGITELHGGTVSVASDGRHRGACFSVRLPLSSAPVSAAPPAPHGPSVLFRKPVKPLRILLVEDHADTARIMRRLLGMQGHSVTSADTMAGAMRLASVQEFDLLLSDLGLPDGSGIELMRALRAKEPRLPGIALSGYGQEEDSRRSLDAGFAIHLIKPIDPARLAEAIARVIRESAADAPSADPVAATRE